MSDMQPGLFIERLVIRKNLVNLYDQAFHRGVNIIRGEHAVGKSTILDMIFYGLGGEIRKESWVYPANVCDEVILQVEANARTLCIRREISVDSIAVVGIYAGSYDEAMRDAAAWSFYGARRSEDKRSFSQQFFHLMGWGEGFKTQEHANLTMHQLLRMLYVDQETSDFKIFRSEQAGQDSESTRTAIAEFLLGLDDLEAHSLRQRLLASEREFGVVYDRLLAIYRVVGKDSEYVESELLKEISSVYAQIQELIREKDIIITAVEPDFQVVNDGVEKSRREISNRIHDIARRIEYLNEEASIVSSEIADCEAFSKSLMMRKAALLQSRAAFDAVGSVDFTHCPACRSPIKPEDGEGCACALCKSEVGQVGVSGAYIDRLNELLFQEKNNSYAIERNVRERARIRAEQSVLHAELMTVRSELESVSAAVSIKEEEISRVAKEIGFAESQIETLKEKVRIVQEMDHLRAEKERLNKEILSIRERLDFIEAQRKGRRAQVMHSLAESTCELLREDGGYEPVFEGATPEEVEIDFARDRWLLDGRLKFSGSSNFIKKNSLHVSCLATALRDSGCRYPRFLMLDGIENGGMKPERSQGFQRHLVEMLSPHKDQFQLIFVTAMIDESLNNERYCVGPYYEKGSYILNVASAGIQGI